jgi:hypothetical protein
VRIIFTNGYFRQLAVIVLIKIAQGVHMGFFFGATEENCCPKFSIFLRQFYVQGGRVS